MADIRTVAAVDIGTNSVKLTVARRTAEGSLEILTDTTEVTRLGKNVDAGGRLDESAVEKTLFALSRFAQIAREQGAESIAAVGTSAMRDASNGAEFVLAAEKALGGTVEVISGDREATLTYQAARRDTDLALPREVTVATTDIGGGSTEVVVGGNGKITFQQSLQLGAVRLTERAHFSDPPTPEEISHAGQIAEEILLVVPEKGASILVGSGGTIANLAAMEICASTNRAQKIASDLLHATSLTRAQIEARISQLAALPLEERRNIPGLEPDRADVIIAGAIIQTQAMLRLRIDTVLVSARGLRYGLLYELLGD